MDLRPALFDTGQSPREVLIYYRENRVYAARKGPFKIHFVTKDGYGSGIKDEFHDPPLLFNLEADPSERHNIAGKHPDIIADIIREIEKHQAGIEAGPDQLAGRLIKHNQ